MGGRGGGRGGAGSLIVSLHTLTALQYDTSPMHDRTKGQDFKHAEKLY